MPQIGAGKRGPGQAGRRPPKGAPPASTPAAATGAGSFPAVQVIPRRGRLHALLATIRPRQWIKNGLVVAAPGAAGALGHDDVPLRVLLACLAFCLLASGIYAINDVKDAAEDRLHPRKRFRPVAAGELTASAAAGLALALMAAGLALCVWVRPLLGLVGIAYLGLTLSYTFLWRHIVILDVLAVAGGFVLRAVAGGVAAPVTLSRWFLLVVSAAAVLLAGGKRLAELRRATDTLAPKRRVLHSYDPALLRLVLIVSTAVALVAYVVWALLRPAAHGIPWRPLTIVPFALCLARYGVLLRRGDGEAPEELLLHDRPLQLGAAAWLLLFALAVNAAT